MPKQLTKTYLGVVIAVFLGPLVCLGGVSDMGVVNVGNIKSTTNLKTKTQARDQQATQTPMNPDGRIVRSVQEGLNEMGYRVDTDGIQGKDTANAIKKFQKKLGLSQTGRINSETMAAMNIDTDTGARTSERISEYKDGEIMERYPTDPTNKPAPMDDVAETRDEVYPSAPDQKPMQQ